jgi:D-alanyl-D-alanine carboxypeptidase
MKRHLRKVLIVVFGSLAGISVAVFLMVTAGLSLDVASNYINEFKDDLKYESLAKGGPEPEYDLFRDRDGNRIFVSNYEKSYKINKDAPNLGLEANSFLIGDLETGEILISKNQNRVYPIASITKLMTAVVADEKVGITSDIVVTKEAVNTYGKQGRLKEGERYTVLEILYPLLLESSNDAAEAIALNSGRRSFIDNMNGKAKAVGMVNTYFDDASGLSAGNTSSVDDLFKLIRYIYSYRSYIFDITVKKSHQGQHTWYNNSSFRSDENHIGGKNGYTDHAQKTQVVIFNTKFEGGDKKIAYIVLKSGDVKEDIRTMRKFVERYVRYE